MRGTPALAGQRDTSSTSNPGGGPDGGGGPVGGGGVSGARGMPYVDPGEPWAAENANVLPVGFGWRGKAVTAARRAMLEKRAGREGRHAEQ